MTIGCAETLNRRAPPFFGKTFPVTFALRCR